MSEPDYYLCDVCKAQVPRRARVSIATGRYTDPAGSTDDVGFNVDLCGLCWPRVVGFLNSDNDKAIDGYALGVSVMDWILKNKKK